jgi:V/A-type H+-transporting ATPase subunit I
MRLRPKSARWFRAVVDRADGVDALEALARTQQIEVESVTEADSNHIPARLSQTLEAYDELKRQYEGVWPRPRYTPEVQHAVTARPDEAAQEALDRVRAWVDEASDTIERVTTLRRQDGDLRLWQSLIERLDGTALDVKALSHAGPQFRAALILLPPETDPTTLGDLLATPIDGPDEQWQRIVVVIETDHLPAYRRQVESHKGRFLTFPEWLQTRETDPLTQTRDELNRIRQQLDSLQRRLNDLDQQHHLAESLGTLERLMWFTAHSEDLQRSDNLLWITGWTGIDDPDLPRTTLHRDAIRALVDFPDPPSGRQSPAVLANPRWARPFELFTRALGIPKGDEIDPSPVVAVIVPLMFGYMFGDIGHGLVLFLLGTFLMGRFALARLIQVCGLSGMVFGVLFGSLFAREDLFPPLWLHPIEHPLTVMAIPMVGGILLLTLGLIFAGAQRAWQHGGGTLWWVGTAGHVGLYLGLLLAVLNPAFLLLAATGLIVYLGTVYQHERVVFRVLAELGELVEATLQILINTLSFVRVGAFALAHAGLSTAVIGMAEIAPGPIGYGVVLVLGNVVIILLEGLVVSIQTTRLILFEFFVRFFQGRGRPFRPLPLPPSASRGNPI